MANYRIWAACAVVAIAILFSNSFLASPASAQGLRGVLDDLVRGTARIADEVPVRNIDDLVADLSKSRSARNVVDTELRAGGRVMEAGGISRGAARSDEVLALLRTATSNLDPTVMRRIEQLDDVSRDAALVIARGGDELAKSIPDLATRGRLIREGGAETVATVGMFGPEAGRAAQRLDQAIKGGGVIAQGGGRVVSVADFGAVMTRYGDASWRFWMEYIRPNWKAWAASGALAAYLSNPELFQDAAGHMTEAGFRLLSEFVGEVAAAGIRGIGEGAGTAVEKAVSAATQTYFNGKNSVFAAVGTIIFLLAASLLFRRVRRCLLRPLQWLSQSAPS